MLSNRNNNNDSSSSDASDSSDNDSSSSDNDNDSSSSDNDDNDDSDSSSSDSDDNDDDKNKKTISTKKSTIPVPESENKAPAKKRKSTRISKYKIEHNIYSVYMLKLMHPSRNLTYIGSTQNFGKRISQHNGKIPGGANSTYNLSESNKYLWVPICVVSGLMTKSESLGFEKRLKMKKPYLEKKTMAQNITKKSDGTLLHNRIRRLLILLCSKKWTKRCRDACNIPVTLRWFLPSEKPSSAYGKYLPSYVTEIDARDQLKDYVF